MNDDGQVSDDVEIPEEAFISPDEPLEQDEGGVVVGMDGSAEHAPVGFGVHLEPGQMAAILEDVAAGLKEHGSLGCFLRCTASPPTRTETSIPPKLTKDRAFRSSFIRAWARFRMRTRVPFGRARPIGTVDNTTLK